jgi:hypothetical protein
VRQLALGIGGHGQADPYPESPIPVDEWHA